jgi:hypothetical protein
VITSPETSIVTLWSDPSKVEGRLVALRRRGTEVVPTAEALDLEQDQHRVRELRRGDQLAVDVELAPLPGAEVGLAGELKPVAHLVATGRQRVRRVDGEVVPAKVAVGVPRPSALEEERVAAGVAALGHPTIEDCPRRA